MLKPTERYALAVGVDESSIRSRRTDPNVARRVLSVPRRELPSVISPSLPFQSSFICVVQRRSSRRAVIVHADPLWHRIASRCNTVISCLTCRVEATLLSLRETSAVSLRWLDKLRSVHTA